MREQSVFEGDAALPPAEHGDAKEITAARSYSSWRRRQNQWSVP